MISIQSICQIHHLVIDMHMIFIPSITQDRTHHISLGPKSKNFLVRSHKFLSNMTFCGFMLYISHESIASGIYERIIYIFFLFLSADRI